MKIIRYVAVLTATEEDGSYGRLLNDDVFNPSLRAKTIRLHGKTRIAFFATRHGLQLQLVQESPTITADHHITGGDRTRYGPGSLGCVPSVNGDVNLICITFKCCVLRWLARAMCKKYFKCATHPFKVFQICNTPLQIFQICNTPLQNISNLQHTPSKYFKFATHGEKLSNVQHTATNFQMCNTLRETFKRAAPCDKLSKMQHTAEIVVRSTTSQR